MYSVVHTAVLSGIDACLVSVEADISNGMPMFEMVGLLASEVRESKERVRTALKNCQYELPIKRITVNLAPANIRKSGPDLICRLPLRCWLPWRYFRRTY